jgi:hypothetical protein
MKIWRKAWIIVLFMCVSGCVSRVVKENVRVNTETQKEYVKRMDEGNTTSDQDKEVIRAQSRNWEAINRYLNGDHDE